MEIGVYNVNKDFLVNPVRFTGTSFSTENNLLNYVPVGFSTNSSLSTDDITNVDLLSNTRTSSGIIGFIDARETPKVNDGSLPLASNTTEYMIYGGTYIMQNYVYNLYPSGYFPILATTYIENHVPLTIRTRHGLGQGWGFERAISGDQIYTTAIRTANTGEVIPSFFNFHCNYSVVT